MREFYFIVSPTEKPREKDMRVYGLEKTRKQQGNYKETAEQMEPHAKAEEKAGEKKEEKGAHAAEERKQTGHTHLALEMEKMQGAKGSLSLKERQEQLVYQKKAQESRMRHHQMAMAYGKE